ncbi:SpoIIE family protein phosphatase [Streptomyces sp. NPDC050564]|uniref:SpoIIE family protein phosphatase n=1 Tax=Streptomyces sp. NPDC050564 TaxID=3365631 RepID=UPI00378AE7AA
MAPDVPAAQPLISSDVEAVLAAAGGLVAGLPLGREYRILRRIVEGTRAAVAVLDTELRFRYVNPRMARVDGLSAEAHLGRSLTDVLPGAHRAEQVLREVLRDGRPRQLVLTGFTLAPSPPARRLWRATYHRLEDEHGKGVGLVGVGLEITEPRQTLHALERAHQRMALLDTAVTRIGTALDIDATCGELADFVVPELADAAGVELFQQDRPGARRQTPPGVMRLRRAAVSAAPQFRATLREIGATGVSLEYEAGSPIRRRLDAGESWMFDLSAGDVLEGAYADWIARYRAVGVHSVLITPLGTEDRLLGTLSMVRVRPSPPFTREDALVAKELAARAARALDRAFRYAREHAMALELQRALLTEPTVPHPNLETAFRYLPADDTTVVGGDWFDALALSRARNLLVIGDVMGHGVEAAVAMSHYRSMLRALADTGLRPHEMLQHADRMVADAGFDRVATCLLALGDPRANTVSYANAGHLPPVRLTPQGHTEIVPLPVGPPLGTGFGSYETVTRPGVPGGTLLLYTDGLVERRDEDIDDSLRRLTRLRLSPRDSLDKIVDDVLAQLMSGPAEDDVAVLAARVHGHIHL